MGRVVVRHVYIDGRCSAVVSSDMEWGIIIFPTVAIAEAFAKEFNLEYENVSSSD
jgi:hypothetical protein